ncbi:MAG: GAF domain-containing protein, partial [Bacteroidota bacterium]
MSSREINKRRTAELKILRLNRTYAVLSNINRLIARERSKQRIFEESCRIAVEHGKLRLCWIGLVDETANIVKPVACAGAIDGYLKHLQIALSDAQEGKGPTGTAVRDARNVYCSDIEHDERMLPWKEKALTLGLKSMAVFPLQAAAKVIGTINFYANEVNYFGEEERELYNELVKDISFALEMLENEESLRNTHAFNEMLLQTIPFGMDIVDERGTVLFMNTAMKNIFGRDDAGQLCWSLSKNGKKHCLHCPLQKGIEISRIDILESMNALDGRIFQIHLIGIMFRGKK